MIKSINITSRMIKTVLSTLAIAGVLTVADAATQASHADQRGYAGPGHVWYGDTAARHGGAKRKTLKRHVSRVIRRDDVPLRRLFGLRDDYAGYGIETVTVKLKGKNNRGRLRLMVNGNAVDSHPVRGERVVRLQVPKRFVMGRNLRTLRLAVDGKAHIKDIKLRLRRAAPVRGVVHRERDDRWDRRDDVSHGDHVVRDRSHRRTRVFDEASGAPLMGGILGAVAGTQVGKGKGRVAAIIGGGILGSILGDEMARSRGY